MAEQIYDINVKTIDGEDASLSQFEGKVLLMVNVASKCGLTPQYEGLQKLHEEFEDKDFEILAFPANNFMGQEPGTEEEIKEFCNTNYGVEFPMFSKVSVKGEDQHLLYQYLVSVKPETDVNDGEFEEKLKGYGSERSEPSEVLWNFEKFLIAKNGEVVARFAPDVTADDERLREKIEAEVSK